MKQNNQKIIIGVLGLPIRKKDNEWEFFLTQRLSLKHPDSHLKWQLSGGGMEFGESPEETLLREFKEELDVIPKILYPHPIVVTTTWRKNSNVFGKESHVVLLTYIVSIDKQIPQNVDPDHETGDMRWFKQNEIKNLDCMPNTNQIFNHVQNILKGI